MMDSTPYSEGVMCVTVDNFPTAEIEKVEGNQCEIPSVESLKGQLQKAQTEVAALRESLNVKLRLVQDLKRQLKASEVKVPSISIKRESKKYKVKKNIVDTLISLTQDIPTTRVTRLSETLESNETKVDTIVKPSKIKQEISKYQPGDKIFAKVKGFVYWPSRVNPIPEDITIPPNKIPIFFYGTHEVYFISPTHIWPFEKNKYKWGKPNPRAHFNQALDEIENNPTLFQYGADPDAEDFLGQFYQFKRSNGEISSGMRSNEQNEDIKSDFINDDNKSSKSKTDSVKKRHASSSSSFKLKEEDYKLDMKKNEPNEEKLDSLNSLPKTREKKNISNEIDAVELQEKKEVQRRSLKKNASTRKRKSNKSFINEPDKNEDSLVIMSSDTEIKERQSMKTRNFSGSSLKTVEELNMKNAEESLKQDEVTGDIASRHEINDTHSLTIIVDRKIDGLDEVRQKDEDLLNTAPEMENNKKESLRLRNVSGASLKSNEERRNVGQRQGNNTENLENITPENSKKDSLRKRNSSGSAIITRRKSDAEESQNYENRLDTTLPGNDESHKELSRKRNSSGIELSTKEITNMDSVEENKANNEIDYEKPHESEYVVLSRLRSRSLSISNETKKSKSSSENVAKKETDSDAVLSDNPKDEDFKPTEKASRMPKKSSVKISKLKKNESKTKSKGRSKMDKKTKKRNISESDSISSISSVEHWNKRDEMKSKDDVKLTKKSENEKLLMDDLSIKKSDSKFEEENSCVQIRLTDMTHSNILMNVVEREVSHEDKELVANISITDIGKGDTDLKESEVATLTSIANNGLLINQDKIEKDKLNAWTDIANESKPLKQINTEKLSPKKKSTNSCKRRRLDTDEIEDTPVERKNKRVKSSRIKDDDSDIEITNVKLSSLTIPKKDVFNNVPEVKLSSLTIPKKDVVSNNVVEMSSSDKIKTLQTCNSDIRSSLVLGHEDYEKCVEKFKSLCTMDLDLISLVTVWQLMDTVKKCRRYKRNEAIKNEAQNVYKRFMDIYSQSTVDEVHKAQLSLANNKIKSDTSINGQSQNPNIPSSVEDMFHHHNNNKKEFETSQINNESPPKDNFQPATNDEEKMRLLSADLEAKVSDIMNKIERNTSVSNQINRQSMTHLLPSRTENPMIQLPVTWESVDSNNQFHHHHNNNHHHHHHHHYQQHKSLNNSSRNKVKIISDDEDDEDDVDAIVKRIEEIPIPQMDVDEEDEDDREDRNLVIANDHTDIPSATSALDARIQNLFNTAMITDTKTKKPRVPSRPHGHKPSTVTRDRVGSRSPSSSTRYMISPNKTSPHKDILNTPFLNTKEDLSRPIHSITASIPTTTSTTTKINVTEHNILDSTDNVIYNLLGV